MQRSRYARSAHSSASTSRSIPPHSTRTTPPVARTPPVAHSQPTTRRLVRVLPGAKSCPPQTSRPGSLVTTTRRPRASRTRRHVASQVCRLHRRTARCTCHSLVSSRSAPPHTPHVRPCVSAPLPTRTRAPFLTRTFLPSTTVSLHARARRPFPSLPPSRHVAVAALTGGASHAHPSVDGTSTVHD